MTDKDNDIVDFISKNYKTIGKSLKDLLHHFNNIWHMAPNMITDIFIVLYRLIYKIIMKIRSFIVLRLKDDIIRLKQDKTLWNKLKKDSTILNKVEGDTKLINRIGYYINKNKKTEFLSYLMENQHNKNLIIIRDQLFEVDNGITNNDIFIKSRRQYSDNELEVLCTEMEDMNKSYKIVEPIIK
jgi:hypothetical protein